MGVKITHCTFKEEKSATAECNICNSNVSRGGSAVGWFNTTNIIKHLEKHHKEQHQECLQAMAAKKSKTPEQQTLLETIKRREKLPPDSNKAKLITEKLVQFIVLDNQPLLVVENVGFRRLIEHIEPRYTLPSHHYIMGNAIPHMHKVCDFLSKLLENVGAVSFHNRHLELRRESNVLESDHTVDRLGFYLEKSGVAIPESFVAHTHGIPSWELLRRCCVNGRLIKTM